MIRDIDNECDYRTKASVGYTEGLQEETRRNKKNNKKRQENKYKDMQPNWNRLYHLLTQVNKTNVKVRVNKLEK